MLRCIVWIAGACMLLSGCQSARLNVITSGESPTVTESSHVDPKTGNLIALWMTKRDGTHEPVLVTHAYAVFIQWPSEKYCTDSKDKRGFLIYDNVAKKCYQTSDFDAFLKVLATLPRDITILKIDTCTMSRDYMPNEQRDRLEKCLAKGNRKWAANSSVDIPSIIVCYCECNWDFIFPGDKH